MNTLILGRPITAEDVLNERIARSAVLYSPCQDNDIKWRYCSCFICRSVWDPTGEADARMANEQRQEEQQQQEEQEPEQENDDENPFPSPISLPQSKDLDKRFTLTGSEISVATRLLDKFQRHLDRCIEKLTDHHKEDLCIPPPPPELDELFATKTEVMNILHDLNTKLIF
jgi:Zn-finger nucleic acid-binding protein